MGIVCADKLGREIYQRNQRPGRKTHRVESHCSACVWLRVHEQAKRKRGGHVAGSHLGRARSLTSHDNNGAGYTGHDTSFGFTINQRWPHCACRGGKVRPKKGRGGMGHGPLPFGGSIFLLFDLKRCPNLVKINSHTVSSSTTRLAQLVERTTLNRAVEGPPRWVLFLLLQREWVVGGGRVRGCPLSIIGLCACRPSAEATLQAEGDSGSHQKGTKASMQTEGHWL